MKNNITKKKNYKQLSFEERIKIAVFFSMSKSITEIASVLKQSKSTISREIARNKNERTGEYSDKQANDKSRRRKKISM